MAARRRALQRRVQAHPDRSLLFLPLANVVALDGNEPHALGGADAQRVGFAAKDLINHARGHLDDALAQVSADELMRFVAERVAPYKKVREVEFVQAIPKTPSGKILRRELIEQERAKSS